MTVIMTELVVLDESNSISIDFIFTLLAGTPVASNAFVNGTIQWALSKITNHSQIVMGVPAYGYLFRMQFPTFCV